MEGVAFVLESVVFGALQQQQQQQQQLSECGASDCGAGGGGDDESASSRGGGAGSGHVMSVSKGAHRSCAARSTIAHVDCRCNHGRICCMQLQVLSVVDLNTFGHFMLWLHYLMHDAANR